MKLIYIFMLLGVSFKLQAATTTMAHAKMISKSGSQVGGSFDFKETNHGLEIKYDLAGLPKNKTLGVHIHEKGDCSSLDAKSAGDHYAKIAPTGGTSLDFPGKYAGDLPPLQSDEFGKASGSFLVAQLSLVSGHTIKDRAIIIHGGPDNINEKSAPRIACGKIESR